MPHKDFEVKEYENKTIIAYKNYAYEFGSIRNKSKNVEYVIMKYYYDIKKNKNQEEVVGYK